jgi:hypothetical protein
LVRAAPGKPDRVCTAYQKALASGMRYRLLKGLKVYEAVKDSYFYLVVSYSKAKKKRAGTLKIAVLFEHKQPLTKEVFPQ